MRFAAGIVILAVSLLTPARLSAQSMSVRIEDYAAAPRTGTAVGTGNPGSIARINFLREEPSGAHRFFLADLNGPLYILDKTTKTFTTYLNFNGRDAAPGLFDRFTFEAGFANGLIAFAFDPAYGTNGRFYTLHMEEPSVAGSTIPDKRSVPGLDLDGYTATDPVTTPGAVEREAIIVEWTDSNTENTTFEGTARELLRIQLNSRIHPTGDLSFNPAARRGDADWRVMYIGAGDGGSGEQTGIARQNPQRLDTLVGKILRIIPDLSEHTASSTPSPNGRYRIPNDNPFVATQGARGEIWAYGFRNPHRLIWDIDPSTPDSLRLITTSIGLRTWETINFVHKGANYGYSEREGNEQLLVANTTGPLPADDRIPVRVNDTQLAGSVKPTYPVVQYDHFGDGGFAIAGGFVYRGAKLPALRGKFIFADIRSGQLWYADYDEMLKADDGKAETLAARHELRVVWDNPADAAGPTEHPTMAPVVTAAFHARRAADPNLKNAAPTEPNRADIRFAVDGTGELYIMSKVDGMIRAIVGLSAD